MDKYLIIFNIILALLFITYVKNDIAGRNLQKQIEIVESEIEYDLKFAIQDYESDIGFVPSTQGGLKSLVENSFANEAWAGPYLENKEHLVDPWGRPYIYSYPSPMQGKDYYLLSSLGQDGMEGTADDIIFHGAITKRPDFTEEEQAKILGSLATIFNTSNFKLINIAFVSGYRVRVIMLSEYMSLIFKLVVTLEDHILIENVETTYTKVSEDEKSESGLMLVESGIEFDFTEQAIDKIMREEQLNILLPIVAGIKYEKSSQEESRGKVLLKEIIEKHINASCDDLDQWKEQWSRIKNDPALKQLFEEEQVLLRMYYAEYAAEQCKISGEDLVAWLDYFWKL